MDDTAKDQKAKALRFLNFCTGRFGQEAKGDHQTAAELGFSSPEMLYKQLELDGSPVCGVCGQLYPDPEHRKEHKSKRKPRRSGSGGGHRVKLPDASRALDLFHTALKELEERIWSVDLEESWLEGTVEEDKFKGKHFITHSIDRDNWEPHRREKFTEEEWKKLCQKHGVDPGRDEIMLPTHVSTTEGVKRKPSYYLTSLIAAYALTYQPLDLLIEALHHHPDAAAEDEIYKTVDKLHTVAGYLATWVRGGIVESGRAIEEVSDEKHFLAWVIRELEQEGASSEEIQERMMKEYPYFASGLSLEELTPEEIEKIKRLRLNLPE